jgi:carbonic anhydrase
VRQSGWRVKILFGWSLGELFIIRNAGNTVDLATQGSIEYAVAELGMPLILVLGHERCGAVAAALKVVERSATFPGRIGHMVEPIISATLKARQAAGTGANHDEVLDAAIRENGAGSPAA